MLYTCSGVFVVGDALGHVFTCVLLLKVAFLLKVCLYAQEASDSGERQSPWRIWDD